MSCVFAVLVEVHVQHVEQLGGWSNQAPADYVADSVTLLLTTESLLSAYCCRPCSRNDWLLAATTPPTAMTSQVCLRMHCEARGQHGQQRESLSLSHHLAA
eukprot:GHRR01036151.1.p1 GENE.GHRR01036151.1~~GHRR01036151.1.p1  ORF type:complete len:101 (-),score=15.91 GHRR01036151.1:108-410(-)